MLTVGKKNKEDEKNACFLSPHGLAYQTPEMSRKASSPSIESLIATTKDPGKQRQINTLLNKIEMCAFSFLGGDLDIYGNAWSATKKLPGHQGLLQRKLEAYRKRRLRVFEAPLFFNDVRKDGYYA